MAEMADEYADEMKNPVGGLLGHAVSAVAGAITQGLHNTLPGLASWMLGLKDQVDENNNLIHVQGQQIADLADFVGTGTTTPIWSSTGGRDLVTFPDVLMQPIPTASTASESLGSHSHGISNPGTSSSTQSTSLGSHNHTVTVRAPAFNQGKNALDIAFLRGGRDTPTPLEVVRIITGADSSLFDINAWHLGIYVYDIPNDRLQLVWNSGDIKNVLTSQRQRYHIATGMTQEASIDQLLAVGTLQLASVINPLQQTRGIGCVFQTSVSEQAGTVPQARMGYLADQSSLPAQIPMSSITWDRAKLMWAAVGAAA